MPIITHLQQVINRILIAHRMTDKNSLSQRQSLVDEYNKIQKGTSRLSRSDRNRCIDGFLRLATLLKQAENEKKKGIETNKLFESEKT